MTHVVRHWVAARDRIGYGPAAGDLFVHGTTLEAAVEGVKDRLRSAAGGSGVAAALERFEELDVAAVEHGAAMRGPAGPCGAAAYVDGWEYWVMPCFAPDCNPDAGADIET
jgi:hypothetical protein